ncbi:MAG: SUMF1/EgtB/PvdO family nonheme iron enzyme, partial [Bacteroidetes bacterium]|nr:SUMF1/EgtB/PvdO family nonheme iron enzyme [Bacteroidota bacterium]
MSTDLPQKIKDLIIKNKLKEACQLLMNTSVSKEAIGLMSRIEKLNNLILTNQISNEEATREESRITQTLLRLIEKLVDKTTLPLRKNRLSLIIGGIALGALILSAIWLISQNPGKTDCYDTARPYTIIVADFMQENPAFARRVVTNLVKNFPSSQGRIGIIPLGRFMDPLKAKADTFAQIVKQNCVDKGIILYGTLDELGEERLFNGFIKLEGLKDISIAAEKVSVDQVVLTNEGNLKVPDEINFSISEQARLVSDFITGLLKYYMGDTTAIIYFQKAIQAISSGSEEKLKDVANIYLGNTYLAAGKADKALETYRQVSETSPVKAEVIWNQSVALFQLEQFKEAAQGFSEYMKIQPLQVKDTILIRGMARIVNATLSKSESEAILMPVAAVIQQVFLEKKSSKAENIDIRREENNPKVDQEGKQAVVQHDRQEQNGVKPKSHIIYTLRPQMINIPGGTFEMGVEDLYDHNKPPHKVTIKSFQLSETEVTNAQYAVFLTQTQPTSADLNKWISLSSSKIKFNGKSYQAESDFKNHPVVFVSWYGAKAYCDKMGYRLPTEAEWETPARAGTSSAFDWGDKPDCTRARYRFLPDEACTPAKGSSAMGAYPANAFGLENMHGNVWEW